MSQATLLFAWRGVVLEISATLLQHPAAYCTQKYYCTATLGSTVRDVECSLTFRRRSLSDLKGQTTFKQPAPVQLECACLFRCTSLSLELNLPLQSAVETTDVRVGAELNPVRKLGCTEHTEHAARICIAQHARLWPTCTTPCASGKLPSTLT